MIKLDPYNLDNIPDYCLYTNTQFRNFKVDIIYLASNTKFGYWFKEYYIPLFKYFNRLDIETRSMHVLCCRAVTAYDFCKKIKQLRKVQGLKEEKDFKKFIQWINKEILVGNKLIWFITYEYLEQLYSGTL